jgi:hypothetical protein
VEVAILVCVSVAAVGGVVNCLRLWLMWKRGEL